MKKLAAILLGYIAAVALVGCDSSTNPAPVTVHDTLRVHDTTYLNDRFAGSKPIVHGQWKFATSTDTGIATLFQVGDSVTANIVWKVDGVKSLMGVVSAKSSITLIDTSKNYQISGSFTDSANHKITRFKGSVLDLVKFHNPGTGLALDSLLAIRTF